jgi:hypothetical protein
MLKNITHQHRVLFLKLFTREIILQQKKKIINLREKQKIEEDKVEELQKSKKQSQEKEEKTGEKYIESLLSSKKPIHKKIIPKKEGTDKLKETPVSKLTKPIFPKPLRTKSPLFKKIHPIFHPHFKKTRFIPRKPTFAKPISPASGYEKSNLPLSSEKIDINLGKLNILLNDKQITMIECPGPNKYLRIKKAGNTNMTKITLSPEEIKEVIDNFAQKAKVPMIGGVFKAAVGNLTITAVVSDFIGTRFLITRYSPYSLLEQQQEQINQAPFHHAKRFKSWPNPRTNIM